MLALQFDLEKLMMRSSSTFLYAILLNVGAFTGARSSTPCRQSQSTPIYHGPTFFDIIDDMEKFYKKHPKTNHHPILPLAPGSSRWFWCTLIFQSILVLSGLTVIFARAVNQPIGVTILVSLFFLSTGVSIIQFVQEIIGVLSNRLSSSSLITLSFNLILWCLFITILSNRSVWMGIDVFFVPTASMYPTIKPGQYILVDTWVYNETFPEYMDIVVIKRAKTNNWMVKRISKWPNDQTMNGGMWFLLGDNKAQSFDSRNFGGVSNEEIIGKARLVLAEIAPNEPMGLKVALTPIK